MLSWFRRLRARIKYRHFERDVAQELETHRAMAQAALESRADTPERARRQAALLVGNTTLAREDARAMWIPWRLQQLAADSMWAWRGIRARGWRAVLVIALFACALAANTLLFSVADSLVFRPVPYQDVDRLVTLSAVGASGAPPQTLSLRPPMLLDDLRSRHELFVSVHAYLRGTFTFVMDASSAAREPTTFITPGLIEMLGARPAWGRSLTEADSEQTNPRVALIAESLASERFGQSRLAVGRMLATSEDPLLVVGVLPRGFQFPDPRSRVWRPLDYPRATNGAVYPIARLAAGMTAGPVNTALTGFSQALAQARTIPPDAHLETRPLPGVSAATPWRLMLMLMGAGVCLLIIACANVASLEIAGAMNRSRTLAIQMALGATRSNLIRTSVLEGAGIVGAAVAMAWGASWLVQDSLAAWLPSRLTMFTANPVDVDARAMAFMALLAGMTWLAASLPVAFQASRHDLLNVLKLSGREATGSSGGARTRRVLTVVEVALAVVLLVGGVLYARTYIALLAIDKGFDSSRVVGIDLTLPTATYSAPGATRTLRDRTLDYLRARPDVESVTQMQSNVFDTGTTIDSRPEVDGRPATAEIFAFIMRTADASLFETLRIPLKRGRLFEPGEPAGNVAITEALAARLWPGIDPIGHRFRVEPTRPWLTVVGVVNHVRYPFEMPGSAYDRFHEVYVPPQPVVPQSPASRPTAAAAPAAAPRPNVPRPGAIFMFLTFAARLGPNARVAEIEHDLRRIDSRFGLRIESVDATYAERHKDRLLAARTVGGFAALSFVVAMAGLYGVMAFLVAGRTREIGIRVALGADRRQIRGFVLGSAVRLVVIGAGLGLAAAVALSRWAQSQFYGVSAADPAIYGGVAIVVMLAAIGATWAPARQAQRVDPAKTLRAD